MLLLDNRVGSGDLGHYFAQWKVPYQLCRLEYADVAFTGHGPGEMDMEIGIEVKKVRDVLNCISDGRFSGHQLPGLVENYARVWLVIEGQYTVDYTTGLLVHRRGKFNVPVACGTRQFMYRDLSNWITTIETKTPVRVRRTGGRVETARFCADLYSWWTHKEWDQHRSHLAFDEPLPDRMLLYRPNLVRRVAKELEGIAWGKSGAVAKKFKSVEEMVYAEEKEWREVEGIGKTLAHRIYESLRGREVKNGNG